MDWVKKASTKQIGIQKVALVGGPDIDARIEFMDYLKKYGFQVFVVGSQASLDKMFTETGFRYRDYHLSRRINPPSDLLSFAQLYRIFRHHRPDIVHAFDTKPCVYARMAARLAGVPIVIGTLPGLGSLYVDDSITNRAIRVAYEKLQRWACYLSDLTIFQNQQDAWQFVVKGILPASKVTVIPGSGVRTDLFDPARVSQSERKRVRAELGLSPNALLVTMVSRLIRSKGVSEFAVAAQIVRHQHPQTNFLLVGPADEESVDRLTPAELSQLRQVVNWIGARNDISTILAVSDIFVLPSFYREGIPRALLEAASMALPIVTTDSPGCIEVVKHGLNGFLVKVRDPDTLAQAILRLVEDPDMRQRFGQESRQRAISHFDFSNIASQIHSVYQELSARKGMLSRGRRD